jgi:hypothetical protein
VPNLLVDGEWNAVVVVFKSHEEQLFGGMVVVKVKGGSSTNE